jgi:hypothetical protein
MARAGAPLAAAGPIITNFPIWLAETARVPSLALPNEPPSSVLSLAAAFKGTQFVIVQGRDEGRYPAAIDAGEPGSECFREIGLFLPGSDPGPLRDTRVFRLVCP